MISKNILSNIFLTYIRDSPRGSMESRTSIREEKGRLSKMMATEEPSGFLLVKQV